MTLTTLLHFHPLNDLRAALETMKSKYAAHRRADAAYRQTFNELSALSRRELADIGLNRSDIIQVATKAAEMS